MFRNWKIAAFGLILLAGARAAEAPVAVDRLNRDLSARFQQMVDEHELPGAVIFAMHHGDVIVNKAFGVLDLESKRPMKTDSIFQIMSMTKPFTAAGLMMLVEEGKVVLTDPVDKYLPEFADQPAPMAAAGASNAAAAGGIRRRRRITVWNLLTHTSGITDPPIDRRKEVQDDMALSLADAVKLYATMQPRFEPGAQWAYSNVGLATAGRIIEVTSGTPYEKFIEERLLKPLGMKDSFYFPDESRIPRIAMLYRAVNGGFQPAGDSVLGGDPTKFRKGAKYAAPEFGLYSTAADVAAFYEMMLGGGIYRGKKILSKASVDVMTKLQTGSLETKDFGFGTGLAFMVARDPNASLDLLPEGSFGHAGAFGTWVWADRSKGLIGVVMIQLTGPNNTSALHIFTAMVNAAVER